MTFRDPKRPQSLKLVPLAQVSRTRDGRDLCVPMPSGVTRDAVMRLDKAALDQWWDALGLRDASWWRKWKRPLPQ